MHLLYIKNYIQSVSKDVDISANTFLEFYPSSLRNIGSTFIIKIFP